MRISEQLDSGADYMHVDQVLCPDVPSLNLPCLFSHFIFLNGFCGNASLISPPRSTFVSFSYICRERTVQMMIRQIASQLNV
jgi:hypothetical protein